MKWLKRIIFTFIASIALFTVGGMALILYFLSEIHGRDHIKDAVLISELENNKSKYEKLISMFREDSPATEIHPNWISPENVIPEERWAEYKRVFSTLKLDVGMRSWGGDLPCRNAELSLAFNRRSKVG